MKNTTNKTVSILGAEYEVKYCEIVIDEGEVYAGLIDSRKKTIEIKKGLEDEDRLETIAHEVAHGYLIESGLPRYFSDEILVEWIARMAKRIVDTTAAVTLIGEGD